MKDLFGAEYKKIAGSRLELIKQISEHTTVIKAKVSEMTEARKAANAVESIRDRAYEYSVKIPPYLEEIRYHIDRLERIVDNEMWPLPKYTEMLFTR